MDKNKNMLNMLKTVISRKNTGKKTLNNRIIKKLSKIAKLQANISRKKANHTRNVLKSFNIDAMSYPLVPREIYSKQSNLHTHKYKLKKLQQKVDSKIIPFSPNVRPNRKNPFPFHNAETVCTLVICNNHEEIPIPEIPESYKIAEEHHYEHNDLITNFLSTRPSMCKGLGRPYIMKALEWCWFYLYISTPSNPVEGLIIINNSNDDKKIKIDILCGSDTYSGVGHYLLGVVRDIAFRIGQDTLLLDSVTNALKFYEKEDFKQCDSNSNERDCIRMSKPVSNVSRRTTHRRNRRQQQLLTRELNSRRQKRQQQQLLRRALTSKSSNSSKSSKSSKNSKSSNSSNSSYY